MIVVALLSAGAASGQTHPDGFFLQTPLSLSSGYDSNITSGSRTLSDTVTLLTDPTLAWFTSTRRTEFSLDYQPEFEFFARNPVLDAWNHASTLRLSHRINSRWSMHVGDYFLSTMDSMRKLENSLVLLPRGRFDQNTFFSDLVYRVNSTTKVTFRFDNALTLVAIPALDGRLDNLSTAGTVAVDRLFSSHHQITASYSFLHVTPLNQAATATASNVNLLLLAYTFTVNPGLLIRLSGGGIEGSEAAFNGAATVEKKLGGVWLAGGYQRYLGFFGGLTPVGGVVVTAPGFDSGVTPNSVYHVFSLRAAGALSRRIGLQAEAQRALGGVDASGEGIKSDVIQARLDYKLNDTVTFFVRADHYAQNINPFLDQSLSRNRYFCGIEIALGRPAGEDRGRYRHGKAPQDSHDAVPPADTTQGEEAQ